MFWWLRSGLYTKDVQKQAAVDGVKLLAPGDFEDILLSVNPYLLASYDDEGLVARSTYVLEAGDYHFYLGDNVRDVEKVPYTMTIDKDRIVRQLSPRCVPHNLHRKLRADGAYTAT